MTYIQDKLLEFIRVLASLLNGLKKSIYKINCLYPYIIIANDLKYTLKLYTISSNLPNCKSV